MMSKIGIRGFTLVEVMVATAVLSLGVIYIYDGFFILLDSYNYYSSYLEVACWMGEKIWQTQDSLFRLGSLGQIDRDGEFYIKNRQFKWNLNYGLIDEKQYLYKIDLSLTWQEGRRKATVLRTAYAMYNKQKE